MCYSRERRRASNRHKLRASNLDCTLTHFLIASDTTRVLQARTGETNPETKISALYSGSTSRVKPLWHDLLPVLTHSLNMACSHCGQINSGHLEEVQQRLQALFRVLRHLVTAIDRGERIGEVTPPVCDLAFN